MKKLSFWAACAAFLLLLAFAGCKKDDPCENITCLNGGSCANGSCNCPERYTGSDCSQQKTPIRIKITSITVTEFPPTADGGAGWDLFDGADIYVVLGRSGVAEFNTLSQRVEDANPAVDHTFSPPSNSAFEAPTETYTIALYDYDDGLTSDDWMGAVQFTPYNSTNGFPPVIEFTHATCSGCTVLFKIAVQYEF